MELETKLVIAFVAIFTAVILGIIGFFTFFSIMTPGNGQHTGYVTAVETYGIFWKTSRVYIKTDTQSSQEDMYCIQDVKLLGELKQIQKSNKKVTLEFNSPFIMPNWKCGGETSVITGINND